MRTLSRIFGLLFAAFACAAIVWLLGLLHLAPGVLLVWSSGAVCLVWLVALITIPWNLHFRARAVLFELSRVSARGVRVEPERVDETRQIARRTLAASIGAHGVSAALLVAIAYVSHRTVWYYFAGFFLLSMGFRPGFEYFRYLRRRLASILESARYPFEDVAALIARVETIASTVELGRIDARRTVDALEALRTTTRERDDAHERKLATIARRFDETLDRLTDNREIVAGLKAFLRMVRTDS